MMFFRSTVLLCPFAFLLAQTPPPKPAPAAPAPKTATPPPVKLLPAIPAKPAEIPDNKVVITVGDEKITAGELSHIIASLPEQYRVSANGAGRKQFVENYVRVKVLAQEGRRRQLDRDPTYLAQLSLQRDNLMAGTVYNSIVQSTPITDEQLKQYYEQHKAEFEAVKASHILIRFKGSPVPAKQGQAELTEEEALAKVQALRKEIEGGADFGTIAKRDSDDAGSGVQGGALGTFHKGQMTPPFEEAAFALPVGKLSEPVKTMFGYHLIKVEQRDSKTLDEVKSEIEKKLRPEAAMKAVESLQKSANIVIDPQYIGEEKK
jgi:peptidyl-prolyl cis-trans isomerase C